MGSTTRVDGAVGETMTIPELVAAVLAFALVAGYAGVGWLRRGRDPVYSDDASILLAAPPPGMTAATATIVDGGPTRQAFTAALLDLASRDLIAFRPDEPHDGRPAVGIAISDGQSTDPRVLANRRLPTGEGETWLLAQLKMATLMADRPGGSGSDDLPSPAAMEVGAEMMSAMAALAGGATGDASVGAQAGARADAIRRMTSALDVLGDPAAVARDPEAAARTIEAKTGRALTPEEVDGLKAWAEHHQADPAGPATPGYIPADAARELQAPFLFGTLLQSYAARHGWIAGLPLMRRIKWRALGLAEIGVALLALLVAGAFDRDLATGIAIGIGAGGIATYLAAPAMATKTPEGARMKAQLAAYRRTLKMSFDGAASMDDVASPAGLSWVTTPDQAVVWGFALGLRSEIEALLGRTTNDRSGVGGGSSGSRPAWYPVAESAPDGASGGVPTSSSGAPPPDASRPPVDPSALFTAIEAIGSEHRAPA